MDYSKEYEKKKVSGQDAARKIKSGDFVVYAGFIVSPLYIDKFVAEEAKTFEDVTILTQVYPGLCNAAMADTTRDKIYFCNAHFSAGDRILHDMGLCDFFPSLFHEFPLYVTNGYVKPNIVYVRTAPMDKNGFFNYGIANTFMQVLCKAADKVIVEVNSNIPYCYGGLDEAIHISGVDHIVESDNAPLITAPEAEATETEKMIAGHILKEIRDGACLQLGIGGMPNALGKMIASSGLKDLGIHTEMFIDSFVDMYEAGCISNQKKNIYRGKSVYTFAFGSQRLYDFLDHNANCASYPVHYVNDPAIIAMNDDVVSINNALEVDLYGQVSSESKAFKQITGTGGQWDFVYGAGRSKGGKSIICLTSTHTDKKGNVTSRIVPTFEPGTVTTLTRNMTNYVATEYGLVQLKGKSTWHKAEALISIAHPDFREELIKNAENMKIWKNSNKK